MKKAVVIFEEFVNAQSEQDIDMCELLQILDLGEMFTQEQKFSFGTDPHPAVLSRQLNREGIVPEGLYRGYYAHHQEKLELERRKIWQDANSDFAFTDFVDGEKYWFCIVDSEGGGEGEGEYVERIVAVFKYGEPADSLVGLVQVTGFYSSDNGTEWDTEYNEVSPKPKTVIQWVSKIN